MPESDNASDILNQARRNRYAFGPPGITEEDDNRALKTQWTPFAKGNNSFIRCGRTIETLPPGLYEVKDKYEGEPIYSRVDVKVDDLISFSNSLSDKVLQEIELFYKDAHKFKEMGYLHRRGYLFYGPAGSGKSCALQQILSGVIKRGGIAFFCGIPEFMTSGVRNFREIEPERPVLCIFEDIDAIISKHGDEDLLALLDGEQQIDHVLNIGTTNYPEKLDKRIVARPRRFDRIIKINNPEYPIRLEYFKRKLHMLPPEEIERWARATEGLAFSALAEMIISVTCLGIDFKEALNILKELATRKISSGDFEEKMGFGS
jgi:SpoVK/Ycf46/Vps4 family AAA+-type ATPase